MNTIHKEVSTPGVSIIPAAACLTLVTLGTISVYGGTGSTFFIMASFIVLFLGSLVVFAAARRTVPS